LKVSLIADLNDPFELLAASVGPSNMRQAMKTLREHWQKTLGILCFGKDCENPVMWAHYADKHNGLCLGFDAIDNTEHLRKVEYVRDRLKGTLMDDTGKLKRGNKESEEFLVKILTTKFKDWSYEKEYRLFSNLETRDPDGRYYFDFNDQLTLRQVMLGARCEMTVPDVARLVKDPVRPVYVFKMRAAFNTFRIVRQQSMPAITISPS
jgi:hypothetical protein